MERTLHNSFLNLRKNVDYITKIDEALTDVPIPSFPKK